jgi:predicted ABC-type ATPase
MTPWLIVLAGPNGSGKSTLSKTAAFKDVLAQHKADMLNADELAKLAPSEAAGLFWSGREMSRQIRNRVSAHRSFSFETTLSGWKDKIIVQNCRKAGYRIAVHYVLVSSVELSILRVINRVKLGGHDVPEADQRRRFKRSLENASGLFKVCDEAFVYLNDTSEPHQFLAEYRNGNRIYLNTELYGQLQHQSWLPS